MPSCASVTELNNTRPCPRTPWPWGDSAWMYRAATAALLAVLAVLVSTANAQAAPPGPPPCDTGVFCAWAAENYAGPAHMSDLRSTNMSECVPLNHPLEAHSLINQTGHPVTVYQDARCSTEAEFSTYPSGSFVPRTPFVARAIQIWPH